MTPTEEQLAIISAVRDSTKSLMVSAYAGTGKTTTLTMIANAVPPTTRGLALAFNVLIKKELEKRFPSNFDVMTLNGLGHRAWSAAIGRRLIVEPEKLTKLIRAKLKETSFDASQDQWASIKALVNGAMKVGLIPSKFGKEGLVPDTFDSWDEIADNAWIEANEVLIDLARAILIDDIRQGYDGTISFDDQIYLSVLFGGVFPRFPLVLGDETQDWSIMNHMQVKRTAIDRLILVGDRKQAIYAFRGADSESMDRLKLLRPEWIELPLATTFRCPKAIVARQQEHAPGFRAWHTNLEGMVSVFQRPESHANGDEWSWTWEQVIQFINYPLIQGQQQADRPPVATPQEMAQGKIAPSSWKEPGSIAILCRNNAPLLSMAFKLLRRGIGVTMLGRDIGKGLVSLAKKVAPRDETPLNECIKLISEWVTRETSLAHANDKESKVAGITDRGECLLAVCESAGIKNARELREALTKLFSRESGTVTLSSIHRAKGLEWDVVLHLDPFRIPSKFARKAQSEGDPRQMQQELNLRYVAETRAKRTLINANLEDFSS